LTGKALDLEFALYIEPLLFAEVGKSDCVHGELVRILEHFPGLTHCLIVFRFPEVSPAGGTLKLRK